MIFVTGGAGFIGSRFVLSTLARTGTSIVNLDKLTYAGNLRNLESLTGRLATRLRARGKPVHRRNYVRLIEHRAEGVIHVVPTGSTSWHGFAAAIVQRLGLSVPVEAIAAAQYASATPRPAYSVLSHEKLASLLGAPPGWKALLDRCVKAWKPQ